MRPEDVRLGRTGAPVSIARVDDIGRLKIVEAHLAELTIRIVLDEDAEIPAEPRVTFDTERVGLYEDSWRVELER